MAHSNIQLPGISLSESLAERFEAKSLLAQAASKAFNPIASDLVKITNTGPIKMTRQHNDPEFQSEYMRLAVEIVSAYVSHNHVTAGELPNLLLDIHKMLFNLDVSSSPNDAGKASIQWSSAAQIRQSVTENVLISFIDGCPYRTLKRHLTSHGLTPAQYRVRYGLPIDYPMTAPGYAAQRSEIAKRIGLGVPGGQALRHAAE